MKCQKCGNELKEGELFCSKCGKKVRNKKSKKVYIIVTICTILLMIIVGTVIYFLNRKTTEINAENVVQDEQKNEIKQESANIQANGTEGVSFANMKADDNSYDNVQQEILKYFDNNYFRYYGNIGQKYPQIFNGAKIQTDAVVVKVIKSTDEEFEVLAVQGYSEAYPNLTISELPEKNLLILKGNQLTERLTKEDNITIYGRYNNIETRDIDGVSYTLPVVNAINVIPAIGTSEKERFNYQTIKTVAEYIFGKNIKITEDSKDSLSYTVTLDNQSNANFKTFNFYKNYGLIEYNEEYNNIPNSVQKRLFVAADFQHYIVTTYDENTKHVYIDYFNKDLEKLWSREFDYNSTKAFSSPIDYTSTNMAIVIDNDLYIIDLATGENVIEPVIVGEKIKINMMKDGIILIGDNNKDTIMKVDYKGNILFRTNADTNMEIVETASTQIVNDKMVIQLDGITDSEEMLPLTKYLVINSDGTIETSSVDS